MAISDLDTKCTAQIRYLLEGVDKVAAGDVFELADALEQVLLALPLRTHRTIFVVGLCQSHPTSLRHMKLHPVSKASAAARAIQLTVRRRAAIISSCWRSLESSTDRLSSRSADSARCMEVDGGGLRVTSRVRSTSRRSTSSLVTTRGDGEA
eukprot:2426015-Rhodomonas_salina.1